MINFANVILEKMAIHKVGNKSKAEKNFFSEILYKPSASIEDKLLKYFLNPFKKLEETFQFNAVENETNTMFNHSKSFFATKENFLELSQRMARHLYDQSKHSKIKAGEVFVVQFSELLYGDEMVDGIGIFKCERKNEFMQVNNVESELLLNFQQGISVDKMDKGCLILNVEQEDGYRVLSVDSVDYFAKHETFNFDEFATEVTEVPEIVTELRDYKKDYALTNDVEAFAIAPSALNTAKKKFKNNIKLDNGVSIKMNFTNPEEGRTMVERGFDEDKGLYFYKIFFNEEME